MTKARNSNPQGPTYDETYFSQWILHLEVLLKDQLSDLLQPKNKNDAAAAAAAAFSKALHHHHDVLQTRDDASQRVDALEKKKNRTTQEEEQLKQARLDLKQAEADLTAAHETCLDTARTVLQSTPVIQALQSQSSCWDDSVLIAYVTLQQATAQGLAAWCARGDQETALLLQLLLQSSDANAEGGIALQRRFLQGGAAKHGNCGRAMQIYTHIAASRQDPVLERLRLAVALELAAPIQRFGYSQKHTVDPLQRYIHYEQAYLLGELDPIFPRLTVWELRLVINNNATEEDLGWGRRSLEAYRPDMCLTPPHDKDDIETAKWQYCRVVRTDVGYRNPDWYRTPHTYDQILAGGGKCGPRAWYGRFVAQTFGIPIWGVRQPGHAAMTRWTAVGWTTCLGAGWQYSWWDDNDGKQRGGLDFNLETRARNALQSNDNAAYMQTVLRLEWIGAVLCKEDTKIIRERCLPDPPTSYWSALALMQRHLLVLEDEKQQLSKGGKLPPPQRLRYPPSPRFNRLEQMQKGKPSPEYIFMDDTGALIIPASCCFSPGTTTSTNNGSDSDNKNKNATLMKSFISGLVGMGQQVFLEKDGHVSYELPSGLFPSSSTLYDLTIHVCTAHRFPEPLELTITTSSSSNNNNNDKDDNKCYEIELAYTKALWQDTKPVRVSISSSSSSKRGQAAAAAAAANVVQLVLARKETNFGMAIRCIKLTPVAPPAAAITTTTTTASS